MRNAACALMLSLILCVQVPAAGTYISDPKSPQPYLDSSIFSGLASSRSSGLAGSDT